MPSGGCASSRGKSSSMGTRPCMGGSPGGGCVSPEGKSSSMGIRRDEAGLVPICVPSIAVVGRRIQVDKGPVGSNSSMGSQPASGESKGC